MLMRHPGINLEEAKLELSLYELLSVVFVPRLVGWGPEIYTLCSTMKYAGFLLARFRCL